MTLRARLLAEAAECASCDPALTALLLDAAREVDRLAADVAEARRRAKRAVDRARDASKRADRWQTEALARRKVAAPVRVRGTFDKPHPTVLRRWQEAERLRAEGWSLPAIAAHQGRHHATVLSGLRRLAEMREAKAG